ncbi:hypothetical protein MJO28_001434 [Puccinia striiformis f. sp. tritici]|uniref:Uncharacterized protein n=1 Tax=Puccinia striiformis f. sp. tritici TaxID=168172 RepID=A0ACC0ETI1_9BASI|nr:hypothetical protein MJO28_001434 [Puccinia striiformis f. sp. tritici]
MRFPQIDHNVQHGTSRRGLRKRYVLGTTLCRLFLPLYIWGCPNNVLFVTDYHPIQLPSKVDLEEGEITIEKMPECVICFEPIDVLPSSPTLRWLAIKSECPVCRRTLPPI